jgi:hypothetical protein
VGAGGGNGTVVRGAAWMLMHNAAVRDR